jgi:hypothetical protein
MPDQKLALFQFASGQMAQARAAATEVMGARFAIPARRAAPLQRAKWLSA